MPRSSLSAPVTEPVIVGHENNSVIDLTVGTAIILTCRADYGDPPYVLTWTNQLELTEETTTVTETPTMETAVEDNAYVTANTLQWNETLLQDTDSSDPINETTPVFETRANTTNMDYKVHRIRVRSLKSLNETVTSYENESTDETTEKTNNAAWIPDAESTTIDYSTYKPEEEPFLLVNTLAESR